MFSQFFVLSGRGDTLVFRDYRGDAARSSPEIFFKNVKKWKDEKNAFPPPAINQDKTHFLYIRRNGLYFVGVTKFNTPPACALELLGRIAGLCKDYCGILNEESIRLNFVLVYELLDEVLDFGYPQETGTEMLKSYVCHQPASVVTESSFTGGVSRRTLPSAAANKPIAISLDSMRVQKNEIFVDLLERLTVLVASNGNVLRSHLDGSLIMRSFLGGHAEVRFGLNEDLVIGREVGAMRGSGAVFLDDCSFHENANLSEFDRDRSISIAAQDGEFTVMHYRISSNFTFTLPFRVYTHVEEGVLPRSLRVSVRLKCDMPTKSSGTNLYIRIPVPKNVISASCEPLGPGQSTDYRASERVYVWKIKKIEGGSESQLVVKMNFSELSKTSKKEVNSVSLEFELPMYICSGLQIRFLKIQEKGRSTVSPYRWVRYITHSDSYVFRV